MVVFKSFRRCTFKGTSTVIKKIDVKLLEIQSKFHFFFNKWKESFHVQKIGNENRLFSLLNFPRAAILNFDEVKWLPLLLKTNFLLFETIGQSFDVIKFKMVSRS